MERPGSFSFRKRRHCASPLRVGRDARDLLERGVGMHDQAVMDVDHLLGEDHRAAAEGEVVKRRRDGPLERVLLADHAEGGASPIDAVEHLVERGAFDHGGFFESEPARERACRFVGVGSHGSEKRDAVLNVGHL